MHRVNGVPQFLLYESSTWQEWCKRCNNKHISLSERASISRGSNKLVLHASSVQTEWKRRRRGCCHYGLRKAQQHSTGRGLASQMMVWLKADRSFADGNVLYDMIIIPRSDTVARQSRAEFHLLNTMGACSQMQLYQLCRSVEDSKGCVHCFPLLCRWPRQNVLPFQNVGSSKGTSFTKSKWVITLNFVSSPATCYGKQWIIYSRTGSQKSLNSSTGNFTSRSKSLSAGPPMFSTPIADKHAQIKHKSFLAASIHHKSIHHNINPLCVNKCYATLRMLAAAYENCQHQELGSVKTGF